MRVLGAGDVGFGEGGALGKGSHGEIVEVEVEVEVEGDVLAVRFVDDSLGRRGLSRSFEDRTRVRKGLVLLPGRIRGGVSCVHY